MVEKVSVRNKLRSSHIYRFAQYSWDGFRRIPASIEASLHPWRRESISKLRLLKDIHRGERCVIIGNGPSLNNTDVQKIRNEFTFGLNRIYLAWEEWGFKTTYFLSVNDLVIEQCAQEMMALDLPMFISWRARRFLEPYSVTAEDRKNLHFLYSTYTGARFTRDVSRRIWEGATVTFSALQLAYHMGFSTVVLIGVDHSFSSQGKPNQTVESQGDDPNHFNPQYFGKGFRWQLPDLDTSEVAYQMAKQAFVEDGREVLDATIDGKLDVFPKINYDHYFS